MNTIKFNRQDFFLKIPYLVFFLFIVLYFSFFNDYVLFFQEKTSLFVLSKDFLFQNLDKPGGILIYIGKFLTTFFYWPVTGALIISTFLTLFVIFLSKTIFYLTGKLSLVFPFLAGIVLFYLQADYRFSFYNTIGLFIILFSFYLTLKYSELFNGWIFYIIVPLLYYLAGSFVWIFLLLLISYFAFNHQKKGFYRISILLIYSFILGYISQKYIFFQTREALITYPFSEKNIASQTLLFFLLAVTISILPLIAKIKINFSARLRLKAATSLIATYISILVLVVLTGIIRSDNKLKQYFYVEKLFYQRKFDEIIDYNIKNKSLNSLTIFLNNIALSEENKLNDLLFHFRQDPGGSTLFLKWTMYREVLRRGAYFYYTIGMINEAHRWAYENMVMEGYTPEGLKMLIKTEILNSNFQVAGKYISVLSKTLFYRKDAAGFAQFLYNEESILSDDELGPKRKSMVKNDFIILTDNPVLNLDKILFNDTLNRRAFEYKLASLLLKKDSKGIMDKLPEFRKFGFKRLPVHIEEAIVAYSVLKKQNTPDFIDLVTIRSTEKRFLEYLTLFRKFNADLKAAEPYLREEFGNTFWYYSFYQ